MDTSTSRISSQARIYQDTDDRVLVCSQKFHKAILQFRDKIQNLSHANAHDPEFQNEFVHIVTSLNALSIDARDLGE